MMTIAVLLLGSTESAKQTFDQQGVSAEQQGCAYMARNTAASILALTGWNKCYVTDFATQFCSISQ